MFGDDGQQIGGRTLYLVQREWGHQGPAWENKGRRGVASMKLGREFP